MGYCLKVAAKEEANRQQEVFAELVVIHLREVSIGEVVIRLQEVSMEVVSHQREAVKVEVSHLQEASMGEVGNHLQEVSMEVVSHQREVESHLLEVLEVQTLEDFLPLEAWLEQGSHLTGEEVHLQVALEEWMEEGYHP